MSDLNSLSCTQIRSGLKSRDFSSREVTEYFLKQIDSHSELNAFTSVNHQHALRQAGAADEKIAAGEEGDLLGVPIAVKDVLVTKDSPTTCGSRFLEGYLSPFDATVVRKLKESGAIILGKTNMDEFAMGSSTENSSFGASLNPWDRSRVPGGSSGGSAVAVAAGLAPAALGTDTGGSIRQPAAFCNLTGLKPTYGRVSRYGLVAYASSLDQVGPMAKDAQDCALIARVIAGVDALDSTSVDIDVPDFEKNLTHSIKGLRIGIPAQYFTKGLQSEVESSIRKALKVYEAAGAELVEIDLPHTEHAISVYYVIAPAEASSNLARFDGVRYGIRAAEASSLEDLYSRSRSEGFGPEVKRRILIGTYVLSSGYYDAYYLQAQKVRSLIKRDFERAFSDKVDLIACPVSPTTAFGLGSKTKDPLEMYLSDIFTVTLNLAGLPGLSMPCGFDDQGLPIGMQLIGNAWEEQLLLQAAHFYQLQTNWHQQMPDLSRSEQG